jgi:solute carrier family 25 carnitine/acylcarnitine transporter 20/29
MTDNNKSIVLEFLAGCLSGFSKIYSGQPFDIVKVRLQSYQGDVRPSPLTVVKNIIQNEGGITALWKGSLPPLLGIGATVSIQFGVNENVKKYFIRKNGGKKMTTDQLLIAGGLAGFSNTIVSAPAEHFRIRMQTQSKENPVYKGSVDCMKKIISQYGIRGAFRGVVPTCFRDSIGYGSYFTLYAILLDKFAPGVPRNQLNLATVGLSGSVAGILFWTLAFPFDVVKTRFQTDNLANPQFKRMTDGFRAVYQAKGLKGFYQGYVPCFWRAIPVNGIVFMLYEVLYRNMIDPPKKTILAV